MAEIDIAAKLAELMAEIEEERRLPDRKWCISLVGGGGKGSYQVGVWKALKELGIMDDVLGVTGSSAGGLNAALMSMGDLKTAEEVWRNITPSQFLSVIPETVYGDIDTIVQRSIANGIFSRDGLMKILKKYLDYDAIKASPIEAYVCIAQYFDAAADPLDSQKPVAEYINLKNETPEKIAKVLLATSAMPYVYPPELIDDKYYRDGCLADPLPIKPMLNLGANGLIVVKLDHESRSTSEYYSQFDEVVEIVPSKSLGSTLDGTLDFSGPNSRFRMLLGYFDTLRTFSLREYNATPYEIAKRVEDDYERIVSTIRGENAVNSALGNIEKFKRYE